MDEIMEFLPDKVFSRSEKEKIINLLKASFPNKIVERRITGDLTRELFKEIVQLLEQKDNWIFSSIIADTKTKSEGQILNVILKNLRYIYPEKFNHYYDDENSEEFIKSTAVILNKLFDIFCKPLKMMIPKKSTYKKMPLALINENACEIMHEYSKLIDDINKQNKALAAFFTKSLQDILQVFLSGTFPHY